MKPKNCPSCGSDAIALGKILRRRGDIVWLPHRWWCECWNCEKRGPTRWTKGRAVRAWNKWNGVILR